MNFLARCVRLRLFTSKCTATEIFSKHLTHKSTNIFQLKTSRTMQTSAPDHPYHVHKVRVSQESIQTKGRIIDFDVSVIDTDPGDCGKPIVLGIHGIPGLPTDFEPCIQRLSENNVRFIGTTLPGYDNGVIESWKLYHLNYSCSSLASVVLQALDQLGIERVGAVMCHSAGAWVGYNIAAQSDKIKSLCLFNPVGGRPHRTLRPQFGVHTVAWLLRFRHLYFVTMPLLVFIYKVLGFTGVKGGDHLVSGLQILSSQDFGETRQCADLIKRKHLPLLYVYTLNDKIVERSVYEEMLFHHLKVPPSVVTKVDSQRNQTPLLGSSVDQEPATEVFARALQFERGGHIAHKAYSPIVMEQVMKLLKHVENVKTRVQ